MAPHWNQDRPRGDGLPDRAPLFDETPRSRADRAPERAPREEPFGERKAELAGGRPAAPTTPRPAGREPFREDGSRASRVEAAPPPPPIRRPVDPFDARPGRETAGAGRASTTGRDGVTDELRYEGPIRLDDEGRGGGGGAQPPDGGDGGRTLLTAALVGGAVILVIGVALYLRDQPPATGSLAMLDEAPMTTEGYGDAWADEGAVLDSGAPLDAAAAGAQIAAGDAGTDDALSLRRLPPVDEPAPNATRRVPDLVEPVRRPAPETARAAAAPARSTEPKTRAPETAVRRTAPEPAPRPAPAPASLSRAAADVTAGLQAMVESGRFGEAATMAKERARFAPDGSYTLQVLFACQEATVATAFQASSGNGLMLFPVDRPGSSCYRLTWGVFPDRDAALAQAGHVPAHFKRSESPLPVALTKAAGL